MAGDSTTAIVVLLQIGTSKRLSRKEINIGIQAARIEAEAWRMESSANRATAASE